MKFKRALTALGALALALALPLAAHAQPAAYPTRSITWVVPFPAGNVTDAFARVVAQALGARLGQTVIVDNRPGAAGIIGTQSVAHAKPDGYTMLYGSSGPIATYGSLYKKLPYSPQQSFVPVNGLAANPLILVINPNKPFKTLDQFIDYARKNPGKVSVGSPGVGTGAHMVAELFQMNTGTTMTHIPYKESSALYGDLVTGRIDAVFDYIPVMRPNIKSGKVLALGVSRDQRVSSFPEIPTFKEKGVNLALTTWSSILLPAGTPPEVVQKLSAAVQEAMKAPEVVKFQEENDQLPMANLGPQELTRFIAKEADMYKVLVQRSGASVD